MSKKVKAPKANIIVGIAQGKAHGLVHNGGQPAPTGQPGPEQIKIIDSGTHYPGGKGLWDFFHRH